jgi:hypothetical protein
LNERTSKPWAAALKYKKKLYYIGSFDSEYEAACAYDEAALKYHGEFATINFPERYPQRIAKEKEIAQKILSLGATIESVSKDEGCGQYKSRLFYHKHTTREQRVEAASRKISNARTGKTNPKLAEWSSKNKPMLGRTHTESSRQKMSDSRRGKKQAVERRIRRSARLQGIPVSEWKDFANNLVRLATKSPEYQAWRNEVYERDDWTCQHCGKRGGRLHAHHTKPKSQYTELMFDVSNGLTLCEPCHHKIHTKMEEARHGIFIKRNPKSQINTKGEENERPQLLRTDQQSQPA